MASRDRADEPSASRRRRDADADAREEAADRRERADDIREGILDRWERELSARALALHMFDEADQASRVADRRERSEARLQRRTDAGRRADLAVERAVDRAVHGDAARGAGAAAWEPSGQRMLEQIADLVGRDGTLAETLTGVLALALEAIDDAAAVSLVFPVEGQLTTAASTADWARELDAAQLARGTGPILDAIARRAAVITDDMAADPRWELGGSAGPDGNRGTVSAMIDVDGSTGALTLYAERGRGFDHRAPLVAAMASAQATLALAWHLERLAHRAQSEAWQRALESRDQIGQAKGILMEQRNLTAQAAFDLLRSTSQRLNSKVRAIAEHVVAHRTLPGDPDVAG